MTIMVETNTEFRDELFRFMTVMVETNTLTKKIMVCLFRWDINKWGKRNSRSSDNINIVDVFMYLPVGVLQVQYTTVVFGL